MSDSRKDRLITPMPRSLIEQINDYRFATRCESKSEAVRRLIEAGLRAERAKMEKATREKA